MSAVIILLKPDCMERRLWGTALEFLQTETDFKIHDSRLYHACVPTILKLVKHYAEHQGKPFYDGLMEFMVSGPILAVSGWSGNIPRLRENITLFRVKYAEGGPRNLIHCSDSPESGEREADIWFP